MTLLAATPPYAAAELLAYLGRRLIPGVEQLAGGAYSRSLRLAHGAGVATLTPARDGMRAELALDDERDREQALTQLRALLDLDAPAREIDAHLARDPLLAPSVRALPGRRVPGTVDGGEIAFRAVLGQQISLAAAATHAGRIVAAADERLRTPVGAVTHLFPAPTAIAQVPDAALAMPATRRRTIRALAQALADGTPATPEALLPLPGIGPWTAAYVQLRAVHDADAFLPTDLGVKHALARLGERPEDAQRLAERWRPWRAYALIQLWASTAGPGAPRAPA
jgi:AraC family transcriptional regulator, regulatory protein of adaptative response / DNA-3-methyladenine glycosylase II